MIAAAAEPSRSTPGRTLFRHAFVPVFLAALAGYWVRHPASLQSPTSGVLFLAIGAIFVAELLYPQNEAWSYRLLKGGPRGWNQLARDIFYLFIVSELTAVLVALTGTGLKALLARGGIHPSGRLWIPEAPFALKFALAFLLVELFSYWLHRATHRIPFLWRFHSTHHVVCELTGLKSLRTHPVDNVFFYVARTTPLLLLGAGMPEVLAATYLGSILGILAHANIDVSDRAFGWVINFPRYHAVHHSAELAESLSNFGCHTVVWDRVFGTFRSGANGVLRLGLNPPGPRTLWQELVWPLYRSI